MVFKKQMAEIAILSFDIWNWESGEAMSSRAKLRNSSTIIWTLRRSKIAVKICRHSRGELTQHLYASENRTNLATIKNQYCPDLGGAVVYIQIKTGINQLQCII